MKRNLNDSWRIISIYPKRQSDTYSLAYSLELIEFWNFSLAVYIFSFRDCVAQIFTNIREIEISSGHIDYQKKLYNWYDPVDKQVSLHYYQWYSRYNIF